MSINQLSIKHLILTVLVLIGVITLSAYYFASQHFFRAAQQAQLYSLNRIIENSSREIMHELYLQTYKIATTFAIEGPIKETFTPDIKQLDKQQLASALDDPFITGFVGVYNIDLVQVRAYSIQLEFIAQSNKGHPGLGPKLPDVLYNSAIKRKGTERNRAIAALWHNPAGEAFYSVLVPLGGIFIEGYLEVVVNPINNLAALGEKMDSPISIHNALNPDIIYSRPDNPVKDLLPIEYTLNTTAGEPALVLTSYENISQLSHDIKKTTFTSIGLNLGLIFIVLAIAVSLLHRFLFRPMDVLLRQIHYITEGHFKHDLKISGLSEISKLAEEFNKMSQEIAFREQALNQRSKMDELTGIANRRMFNETLNQQYLAARRNGTPLSLLMIDIDYFKRYNDHYGHLQGDECLKIIAECIQEAVSRPTDLVARYGGEEFIIVLPDTDYDGMESVANRVLLRTRQLRHPHGTSEISDYLTLSIGGYCLQPDQNHSAEELLNEADKSLYLAKEQGRDRFVLRQAEMTADAL